MKRILLIFITTLLISGCGIGNATYQTSYKVNQNARIDHFVIKCTGYELINEYNNEKPKNGVFVKVNYEIMNNNSSSVLIKPETSFKLYKNNEFISGIGNEITIDKESVEDYTVIFDTSLEDSYKVLFYSNVVSNNIAFELN